MTKYEIPIESKKKKSARIPIDKLHDFDGHPFKVVYLASGDDCRQNLVLLCRGKNEYHMCGRFLKSLQKCVERCGGQHVHLVYDEHLVASHLRWYPCLVHKRLDVFHRVVARGVKFEDVIRSLFVEGTATLALVASLSFGGGVHAVYCLGEYSGTCGLADTSRTAEQVGVCKLTALYRVFQSCGESGLPYNRVKRCRSVFSCRNNVFFHTVSENILFVFICRILFFYCIHSVQIRCGLSQC